jgi:adenylyltransferase/sulfurtransferase
MGMLQATEAIKLLLGVGQNMAGKLLLFDALETKFREVEVERNPDCPVCGEHPTITELEEYELYCDMQQG